MASKNLHDKPFSESTIAKLEIFESYAEAWIPTFVMSGAKQICVFDFFSGTGYDKNGVAGSPIRLLDQVKKHLWNIFDKKVKVKIILNEFEPDKQRQVKFELLKKACEDFLSVNKDVARAIEIVYENEDFEELFPKLLPEINKYPSLVYLDQNGIKFLSEKYFLELEKTQQTDFLYFVSASYFWRFGEREEFKVHLDIDMALAKQQPYRFINRSIIEQLRNKLPKNSKLKLYPFSLKKGANIHGIIFGASHPRAVDKFLTISWRQNEVNGQANFDIDGDTEITQLSFFEAPKLSKIQEFKNSVKEKILNREITNNFDLLEYVYNQGHIGKHASECLKDLKKEGKVYFDGVSPLVTYDKVYRDKRKLNYTVL
jgi:three-Cys-motif partner protein